MKEESQELRWDGSEWEKMVQVVLKTATTSLSPDLILVTEDGQRLEAHSLILTASSTFFRLILDKLDNNKTTATIIYMPGFLHQQLVLMLEFIYQARVAVPGNLLHAFEATANSLGIPFGRNKPTHDIIFEKTTKDDVKETKGQDISEESESHGKKKSIDNKLRIEKTTGDNNIDVNEHFEIAKHDAGNPNNQIGIESEKVEITNNDQKDHVDKKCEQNYIVNNMKDDQEDEEPGEIGKSQSQEDFLPNPKSIDAGVGRAVQAAVPVVTPRSNKNSRKSAGNDNMKNFVQKIMYKKHEKKDFGADFSKSKTVSTRGKMKEMTCDICGKHFRLMPFKKQNNYNKHMKRHEIMSHDCGCSIEFTSFNQKHHHMRVVHQGYLNCDLCPRSFATDQFLKEHRASKHPEKVKPQYREKFLCNLCKRSFKKEESLIHHENTAHDETGPFVCSHCGKEKKSRVALNYHEKIVHNPSSCPSCGRVVKNLHRHTLLKHTDNSKLHAKCEHCGKGFTDRCHLRNHEMNVHIKARPFKCRYNYCPNDIGYNDLSNRNSHERKKHGGIFLESKEL